MSPLSNTSSSGSTPAARIAAAILRTLAGVLMTTSGPEFIVLRSSEQMSGFSSCTCFSRSSGGRSVVPGAATFGSSGLGTKRPPGPVVMLMMSFESFARMRSITSR